MTKPCREDGCPYLKLPGRQRCYWHALAAERIETQIHAAHVRLAGASGPRRMRVPAADWPAGHRWCSGCQSMVPLHYVTGSRCRACSSEANHASRLKNTYLVLDVETGEPRPMTREDYDALWKAQGGRCYICRRKEGAAGGRRFAVDHDHETGIVRGLLCSGSGKDGARSCNLDLLGYVGDDVEMLRRAIAYLENPPSGRVLAGEPLEELRGSREVQERPEAGQTSAGPVLAGLGAPGTPNF